VNPTLLGAVTLAALGLLLPPATLAAALARPDRVALATTGLWILKAMLLLHAAGLALLWRRGLALTGASLAPPTRAAPAGGAATDTRAFRLGLAGALLIGVGLRLVGLGDGLWHDEIQTLLAYGRTTLGDVLTRFDSKNQHPLYSVLANLSLQAFGDRAWALRLPAVGFGVASLWATYSLGARLTARREALLATLLLAVSYHHLWFSQNARGYTALLFFTLTGTAAFVDLLEGRGTRVGSPMLRYAASMALAVWTHATAVMTAVAHAVIWLVLLARRRDRSGSRAWAPAWAVVLAGTVTLGLYAPLLPQFAEVVTAPTMAGTEVAWKNPAWMLAELVRGLAQGSTVPLLALGSAAVAGLAGVWSYWREQPATVALLVLPGIATVVPLIVIEQNLWPRFFFFCAGFAALIGVRGCFELARLVAGNRGAPLATAALLVAAAGSAWTARSAWRPKQDYEGAVGFVERVGGGEDAMVAVDLAGFGVRQYLKRDWPLVSSADSLAGIERRHPRTWVVATFPIRLHALHPDLVARLDAEYDTAAVFRGSVGGGNIVVMTTPRPAPQARDSELP
jgi:hypothetical protein